METRTLTNLFLRNYKKHPSPNLARSTTILLVVQQNFPSGTHIHNNTNSQRTQQKKCTLVHTTKQKIANVTPS